METKAKTAEINVDLYFLYSRYQSILPFLDNEFRVSWFYGILSQTEIPAAEQAQLYATLSAFSEAEINFILLALNDLDYTVNASSCMYPVFENVINQDEDDFSLFSDFALEKHILTTNGLEYQVQYDANNKKYVLFSYLSDCEFWYLFHKFIHTSDSIKDVVANIVGTERMYKLYPELRGM